MKAWRILSAVSWLALGACPLDAARGGPDTGGWMWADSNEPGVKASPESMLTLNTLTSNWADDAVLPVTLSFPFTLYGTTSSTVWLSSNGWLSLTNPGAASEPVNATIPGGLLPRIAFSWSDLAGGPGSLAYEGPTTNGHLIITRHFEKSTSNIVQFEIQFYKDGSVKVFYDGPTGPLPLTIGIEDGAGRGTQIAFNGAFTPGFVYPVGAILFYPQGALGCATAPALACPASVSDTTVGGPSTARAYGCSATPFAGSERVYSLTTTALSSLNLALTGVGARNQQMFVLRQACDGRIDCFAGPAQNLTFPLLPTGAYFVVVDGQGPPPVDDGPFTLTSTCNAVGVPIACNSTVSGVAAGPSGIDAYGCKRVTSFSGPENIYTFQLASPTTVSASLAQRDPFDLFLANAATIAPVTSPCLKTGDAFVGSIDLAPGNYAILVDTDTVTGGPFDLTFNCSISVPMTSITCGQSGVAQPFGPNFMDTHSCGGGSYAGGEGFFRYQPPRPQIVSATPDDPASYAVFAYQNTSFPTTCYGRGNPTLTYVQATPVDTIFVLDSTVASPATAPSMSLACTDFDPIPLACDATVRGTTGASSFLASYSCFPTRPLTGGEAIYKYTNPVTQTLSFGITNLSPGASLGIAVVDGSGSFDAGAPPCVGSGDPVAQVINAPPGDYLVVVDGDPGIFAASFDLAMACGTTVLDCAAAGELACNSKIAGDTAAGASRSFLYGTLNTIYNGPEVVYHLSNPVRQQVSFLLRNPSDPGLELLLLDSCNPSDLRDSGTGSLTAALDPGDYYLVVDGKNGVSGTYELVTFCGDPYLDPPAARFTLNPGQCVNEAKKLFYPIHLPDTDVVFSLDLSASMLEELTQVKSNAGRACAELQGIIPNLACGLASLVEYDRCYTDTACGRSACPTVVGAYPFRMDEPLTTDPLRFDATLQALRLVGGGKETYTRAFYEASTSADIGWRDCSRRVWLSFGDEVPVDCNIYSCIAGVRNEGRDPGPDMVTNTADDLELLPVVDGMAGAGIALLPVDSSEVGDQQLMWDCLAQRTGGRALIADRFGMLAGGGNPVARYVRAVLDALRACPEVRLVPAGPNAGWVSVLPVADTNISTPFYGEYTVSFCVPPGTPAATYVIPVEAHCLGGGLCPMGPLATQMVTIDVPSPCPTAPVAQVLPVPTQCAGTLARLDATSSTPCDPSGLRYRFLDGPNPVCDWSPVATCDVPVIPFPVTYTVEVSCVGAPSCTAATQLTVVGVRPPVALAGPDVLTCRGQSAILDGSGSLIIGCPVAPTYEWRQGVTVVRPALPVATWPAPTTTPGLTTYTLVASCPAAPGCEASDDVSVDVRPCVLAVVFEALAARRDDPAGDVVVTWRTALESGTTGFLIERADRREGPYTEVGQRPALGSGASYSFADATAARGELPWYRVVEMTLSGQGQGDVSEPFPARAAASAGGTRRRGHRTR